jgi:nucleosome binding factor SPN SPT16 subunit
MSEIAVDKEAFHDRLSSFISAWKNDKRASDTVFGGVGSIVICVGKASEHGTSYQKSAAFQLWILGYEFPATLIILTQEGITFVTTKKKGMLHICLVALNSC